MRREPGSNKSGDNRQGRREQNNREPRPPPTDNQPANEPPTLPEFIDPSPPNLKKIPRHVPEAVRVWIETVFEDDVIRATQNESILRIIDVGLSRGDSLQSIMAIFVSYVVREIAGMNDTNLESSR